MEVFVVILVVVAILKLVVALRNIKHRRVLRFKSRFLNADCGGKTVLVTGGNRGIGFCTALEFCKLGANVIIACRSEANAKAAIRAAKAECRAAKMTHQILDLSDLGSVRRLVAQLKQSGTSISLLVNNAGIMLPGQKTKDGFDAQFQVNYLGHFLLTRLLLSGGLLEAGSRVIHVSSMMHRMGRVDFSNLELQRGQSRVQTYNNTKLMNIMFSNELSRRLKIANAAIASISLHPGMVFTDFMNHFVPAVVQPLARVLVRTFASDPSLGATSVLLASLGPKFAEQQYVYLHEITPSAPAKRADPREKGVLAQMERLWAESSRLLSVDEDLGLAD